MLNSGKFKFGICLGALLIACVPPVAVRARQAEDTSQTLYMRDIDLMQPEDLVKDRTVCALGEMPAVKQKMTANTKIKSDAPLPDVDTYCRKVITISRAKHHMMDLYINLALQQQGYSRFHFAEQATLLKNNETGRTLEAVLRAANAGQTTYTSAITGKPLALPCAMALDAGATWADGTTNVPLPVTLAEDEATDVIHQCYDPAVTTITVNGNVVPAQKAGLIAGIWLAKH